jgi:hypothetical protein
METKGAIYNIFTIFIGIYPFFFFRKEENQNLSLNYRQTQYLLACVSFSFFLTSVDVQAPCD